MASKKRAHQEVIDWLEGEIMYCRHTAEEMTADADEYQEELSGYNDTGSLSKEKRAEYNRFAARFGTF